MLLCGQAWASNAQTELGGVQLWENGPYWAECNVGATKPEEYGYYFWWGDTVGYKRNANDDGWISAKDGSPFYFCGGNCSTEDKTILELQSAEYIDSSCNLVAKYDAATAYLGVPWRMPTESEIMALLENCTITPTSRNGVRGRLVTGKGDYSLNSIFFPCTGYGEQSDVIGAGSDGLYWSSSARLGSTATWTLSFAPAIRGTADSLSYGSRSKGRALRPVRGKDVLTAEITFSAEGGEVEPIKITRIVGQALGELPHPSRNGYTFSGWYTAASGGSKVTATTDVSGDVTYYAHWTVPVYDVCFSANGGLIQVSSSIKSTSVYRERQSDTELGPLPTAIRDGYEFLGWFTAASGGTQVTASTKVTGKATYYAHWELVYTIVFDANGGTGDTTVSIAPNSTLGTLPTVTRTGYTFAGWYTAASGGTQVTASTKVTGAATYYAHWEIVNYTITFNANGGTGGTTVNRTYNSTLGTLPTVTRDGYKFLGWFTAASGGTQVTASTQVTGAATYYAHWEIVNYTITFNANGGTGDTTVERAYNSTLDALPTVTRTGYAFVGWFTATSGGIQVTASTKVSGSATYYAHWEIVNYTITFNANGGTGGTTVNLDYNSTLGTLPTMTRTGYTFAGWYTAASGGTQVTASTKVTGAATYYAHWEIVNYTITFNANGGTGGTTVNRAYNSTLGTLPTATRDGYKFLGWYTAASGGTQVTASTKVTGEATYYAHWEVVNYTIIFNANGGTGETTVNLAYNSTLGTLPTATRMGYEFTGWFTEPTGGTQVTSSTVVTRDVTYYARWKYVGLTVSDVVAKPRYPWNGKVDVSFTLGYTNQTELLYVGLDARDVGGGTNLPVRTIFMGGKTTENNYLRLAAGRHVVTWDADIDVPRVLITNLVCSVNAYEPRVILNFDAQGGSATPKSRTVDWNQMVGDLPVIDRAYHTFEGWFTEPDGGVKVTPSALAMNDMTLYAHWKRGYCVVEFNSCLNDAHNLTGGWSGFTDILQTNKVQYGASLGAFIPSSSRVYGHWTNVGWYTQKKGKGSKVTSSTIITQDMTVYAYLRCKVTFDRNWDGDRNPDTSPSPPSLIKYYDIGTKFGTLPTPSRSGYRFVGWFKYWLSTPSGATSYPQGSQAMPGTMVDQNDTYYATWEKILGM